MLPVCNYCGDSDSGTPGADSGETRDFRLRDQNCNERRLENCTVNIGRARLLLTCISHYQVVAFSKLKLGVPPAN